MQIQSQKPHSSKVGVKISPVRARQSLSLNVQITFPVTLLAPWNYSAMKETMIILSSRIAFYIIERHK